MCRPPCVVMVPPWITTGTNGNEAIAAEIISECAALATEVRVKRRMMLIPTMRIAASRIRLPDFNEGVADRTAFFVEDPSAHHNALPLSFTASGRQCEITVGISEPIPAKLR